MPLLNIMSTTTLGTSFFIGFVFLTGETEGDHRWALGKLKTIMLDKGIPDPEVVITNRELALINALESIFLNIQMMLCKWHISKAILAYIKREKVFCIPDRNDVNERTL
jgi:hypothetical protein